MRRARKRRALRFFGEKLGQMAKRTGSKRQKTGAEKKSDDLEALRQRITRLVAAKAMSITRAAVDDAEKKINVAAMKYLFEMIGLYPSRTGEEPVNQKPEFVDTLLRKMGLPTGPRADEEAVSGEEVRMGSG